jgi:hypothetical protein
MGSKESLCDLGGLCGKKHIEKVSYRGEKRVIEVLLRKFNVFKYELESLYLLSKKVLYMILEKCGPNSSIFLNWKFQCVPNARLQIEKIKQDNIPKAGTNTSREIPTEDISNDTSFSNLKLSFGDKTIPIHASLFSESHQDLERDFRLHRFHWLLSSIYQEDSTEAQRQGLQSILFWIAHPHSKNFMDPYSISERVCNWISFLEWLTTFGSPRPLEQQPPPQQRQSPLSGRP